jgi:UDP-N-acetylglucosamine 1-carboxyvinyltransferase
MQKLIIKGRKEISGKISISGSKNATLPILAASILASHVKIKNVPLVKDIITMVELLNFIGLKTKLIKKKNIIEIFNYDKNINTLAPYKLVKTMRAGVLVLGSLLTKYRKAKVSLPGGCAIGSRPVDLHLFALKKLGAKIKIKDGYILAEAKNGLKGAEIKFPSISVGATENALIAAHKAKGRTTLKNCAIEPEIKDLISFLKKLGAKIKIKGRTISIEESEIKSSKIIHEVIFDRIELGTYMIASALLAKNNLLIDRVDPKIIKSEIDILKKIGVKIMKKKKSIIIRKSKRLKKINIVTKPYPGFPTDLQAQLMVLLTQADGVSKIKEDIFENRFMHVPELNRLGAKIRVKKDVALISGSRNFKGAQVMASDLRASVSLVLAALCAEGESEINRVYHLDRGYEKIENTLGKLGPSIKREKY